MDSEEFCCLRYITGAIRKDALNMFPFDSRKRRDRRRSLPRDRAFDEVAIRGEDLFGIRRLAEVVIGAEFQRLHRGCDAAVSSEDDHRDGGIHLLDLLNEVESIEAGHLQIEQDEVGAYITSDLQRPCGGAGFVSFAASIPECPAQTVTECLIVVDDQYNERVACRFFKA